MAKQTALNAQIDAYYSRLDELAAHHATHEGAVNTAFQTLLGDAARHHHWTLIPQLSGKGDSALMPRTAGGRVSVWSGSQLRQSEGRREVLERLRLLTPAK